MLTSAERIANCLSARTPAHPRLEPSHASVRSCCSLHSRVFSPTDVGQQRGQRRRWCDRWTVRPLRCCQHRRQQLLRSASHRHDEMQSAYDGVRRAVRSALHLWLLAALPEGQDRLRSSLRQRGERAVGCVLTEEHVPLVQRRELATPRDAAYTNVISAPRRVWYHRLATSRCGTSA